MTSAVGGRARTPRTTTVSSGRALGLYDLENDAAEKNDLMESDPERGKAVLDRFKAFRRSLREVKVREKKD